MTKVRIPADIRMFVELLERKMKLNLGQILSFETKKIKKKVRVWTYKHAFDQEVQRVKIRFQSGQIKSAKAFLCKGEKTVAGSCHRRVYFEVDLIDFENNTVKHTWSNPFFEPFNYGFHHYEDREWLEETA